VAARSLLILSALLASGAPGAPTIDPQFGDHAVIQRQRPIHLRGTAAPGETVNVTLGSASASGKADKAGEWVVTLPALPAGGPYTLTVSAQSGQASAADILLGDVWLCSGQSNMEFPLRRAMNGDEAIASAGDDQLRILTVPQRTAFAPERRLAPDVRWEVVSPDSVKEFSAVCYGMARDLRAAAKVPIGAIDSSWGGTRVRPWIDEASMRALGDTDAPLLALYRRDPSAAARQFGESWAAWWRQTTGETAGQEPWRSSGRLRWAPFPNVGYWEQWGDPAFASFNGNVWARARFTLTPEEAAKGATLSLGVIDETDVTWINGVPVGADFGWSRDRNYAVAPGVLKAGENELVVFIGDSWGNGGFAGPAEKLRLTFADGSSKPLGHGWEYSVEKRPLTNPPHAPWESHTGLSTTYNAMIAPLGPLGLKGAAWYQGESDVDVPGYDQRLAALMASWRRRFDAPKLPFLIVTLASFGKPSSVPVASGWAEVIDQQRRAAAADPRAALLVATDLGQNGELHPPSKLAIGSRAALAARKIAYGEDVAIGPMPVSATRGAGGIIIRFSGGRDTLQSLSGAPIGFELCAETQQSCRFATARIAGSIVVLHDDGKPITRIRYAWSDVPVMNVYDAAMLPVPSFELTVR
jgi:sialate O-acetylesterase